jgi:hypothetical protein
MPSRRNKYGGCIQIYVLSVSSRKTKQRKTKLTYHISLAILDPVIKITK